MSISDKIKAWTTVSSEYLFRRPWLTVRHDAVRLPNGHINPEFYVLEYPDWVNVIAIDQDGRFVMIKQFRYGIRQVNYELCAGVIEPDETPLQAAKRELSEETGYEGGEWTELCSICANPSTTNNFTHCFLAKGVRKVREQHLEDTEDISVELLQRSDVYALMVNNQMPQALMLVPLWRYFALY